MDRQWWQVHLDEVRKQFQGERTTLQRSCPGVTTVLIKHPQNSGAGAIALAAARGAERVLLLGYDCQHAGGRRHWHGDHPPGTAGNASPETVAKWPAQFRELASQLRGVSIINCSRDTALAVFSRAPLESALT
jgi:hypothetical protein